MRTWIPLTLSLCLSLPLAQEDTAGPPDAAREALVKEFERQGIHLDIDAGICALPVDVCVRSDLLEYLLVGPEGATHESMFSTTIMPSVVNTALLTLGVEPGRDATWRLRDPEPTEAELAAGVHPFHVELPEGDGFYPYVAWRSGEETYFFRLEDMLQNYRSGRAMQRHRWIYLGSRMVTDDKGRELFIADIERNLINVSFFGEGNTLLTAAVEDSVYQTIWMPNPWLLPPRGSTLWLILSDERLTHVPDAWEAALPVVSEPTGPARNGR